jgi:hypothetical protein
MTDTNDAEGSDFFVRNPAFSLDQGQPKGRNQRILSKNSGGASLSKTKADSRIDANLSETNEVFWFFHRFKWQLVIMVIVMVECCWFEGFYRLYAVGNGSIYFWLRGTPGVAAIGITYALFYQHAIPETVPWQQYLPCMVLYGVGVIGHFVFFNCNIFVNPLFKSAESKQIGYFLFVTFLFFGSTLALSISFHKYLPILHSNGRPSYVVCCLGALYLWGFTHVFAGLGTDNKGLILSSDSKRNVSTASQHIWG